VARCRSADPRLDDGGAVAQIVGIVLVHNEDLFVERAIRNTAAFCDRIHAVDHVSTDGTWGVLCKLADEYDHLDVRRSTHAGDSHRLVEPYAGTRTWVFGIDGDELYDPARLADFREELLEGAHQAVFKIAANVLNCVELDQDGGRALGYLSPPSRSITKLYNFAAIDGWVGDGAERLHGGTISFRSGYDERAVDNIGERMSWDETPVRCLHLCFLPRSTEDPDTSEVQPRPILEETGMQDRGWIGTLKRRLRRRPLPEISDWKREKYMRGDLVTVDAGPFF
jgi:hypothetical protein